MFQGLQYFLRSWSVEAPGKSLFVKAAAAETEPIVQQQANSLRRLLVYVPYFPQLRSFLRSSTAASFARSGWAFKSK